MGLPVVLWYFKVSSGSKTLCLSYFVVQDPFPLSRFPLFAPQITHHALSIPHLPRRSTAKVDHPQSSISFCLRLLERWVLNVEC
jgi:hypothetical protein